ncbi:MAG: hypothetical protein F6J98_39465 [Moorea sp. SIO4G2]|uniref:hypothetical protein n=1 Tax=Moorena bouillonii TaxID=207920 RepID=UPI0013018271|nr:hypothetical protein [Moorena bouillonii]NEO66141.1 hypothetical protein [Moorena sp. SIO4G2]
MKRVLLIGNSQRSAVSRQWSAVSGQRSAVSRQPSAKSSRVRVQLQIKLKVWGKPPLDVEQASSL